jgi:hypothetical protein
MADDRPLVGGFGEAGVEGEVPAGEAEGRAAPLGEAALDLGVGDMKVQPAPRDVDGDRVAVADRGQRTALGRLQHRRSPVGGRGAQFRRFRQALTGHFLREVCVRAYLAADADRYTACNTRAWAPR